MGNLLTRLRHHFLTRYNKVRYRPRARADLEVLGDAYGGWAVLMNLLNEQSVCYLAGVGENITFDLALVERIGCHVYAFDPTPRAIEHVKLNVDDPRYHFEPIGIAATEGVLKFYAPAKEQFVSHSITNLREQEEYFEAECRSIDTIMKQHGHTELDLLKIDIEGAEYQVIDHLFDAGIFPKLFCVDFDQPSPYRKTAKYIRRLLERYQVYCVDGWDFHFVRDDIA